MLDDGVLLEYADARLRADRVSIAATGDTVVEGGVRITSADIAIFADEGQLSGDLKRGILSGFAYQQVDSRASAALLQWQPGTAWLRDVRYTTCPQRDERWLLRVADVKIDSERGLGVAWHTRLEAFGIPVFYWPVFQFPVSGKRVSGLLWPRYSRSSNSGAQFSLPIYLNLAPNYDLTVTPSQISRRGDMLTAEARFLRTPGEWQLDGSWLNRDQQTGTSRWVWQLRHQGKWAGWDADLDYLQTSDVDWFDDFSNVAGAGRSPDYVRRGLRVAKTGESGSASLLLEGYESLTGAPTYSKLPQIALASFGKEAPFRLGLPLSLEYLNYSRGSAVTGGTTTTKSSGERVRLSAGLRWPMRWTWGQLLSTADLRHLAYYSDQPLGDVGERPSVTAPSLSVDGTVFLERHRPGSRWTQVVEPRLYYRYTPPREQASALPRIDVGQRNASYEALFAPDRLTGGDRLADINRLSLGFEGRLVDGTENRDVLNWQIGQGWHFADREVNLDGAIDRRRRTPLEAALNYYPSAYWRLRAQLSVGVGRAIPRDAGSLSTQYRRDGALLNIAYRREQSAALPSSVDMSGAWSLGPRWRAVFRLYEDIDHGRSLDRIYGLEYSGCCWRFAVVHRRYLASDATQDSSLLLQFYLIGLGGLGNDWERLLAENVLGYEPR